MLTLHRELNFAVVELDVVGLEALQVILRAALEHFRTVPPLPATVPHSDARTSLEHEKNVLALYVGLFGAAIIELDRCLAPATHDPGYGARAHQLCIVYLRRRPLSPPRLLLEFDAHFIVHVQLHGRQLALRVPDQTLATTAASVGTACRRRPLPALGLCVHDRVEAALRHLQQRRATLARLDGCAPFPLPSQRQLAERLLLGHAIHLHGGVAILVVDEDQGVSRADDEELVAFVALVKDHLVFFVLLLRQVLHSARELLRRHSLECRHGAERAGHAHLREPCLAQPK